MAQNREEILSVFSTMLFKLLEWCLAYCMYLLYVNIVNIYSMTEKIIGKLDYYGPL